MDEIKKCRLCKKEIAADAKKCPYCKSFQNWLCSPSVIITAGLLTYLLFMFMFSFMFAGILSDIYNEGEILAAHPDALEITESKLTFGEKECGPTVVILGKIHNKSKINWNSIHFEVNCYNSKGELIDTAQDDDYSFTAPAETSVSFKASFVREFPEADYKTHEVKVVYAKDANRY
ncbi:MAG: hypothetical protein WC476_05690 [Phycisphaerae bacterium]|jgi:hypothetical protein